MRGDAPEGLFANRPNAVDDVVQKSALPFDALGENQAVQRSTAGEMFVLVAAAITVAGKLQKQRCRQRWPVVVQIFLAIGNQILAHFLGQTLPCLTFIPRRPRMPFLARDQQLGDLLLGIEFAQFEPPFPSHD